MPDRERMHTKSEYELSSRTEEGLKGCMTNLMHQEEIFLQTVNRLDRGDREMKRLARRLEQSLEANAEASRPPQTPMAPAAPTSPTPASPPAPPTPQPERPLGLPTPLPARPSGPHLLCACAS